MRTIRRGQHPLLDTRCWIVGKKNINYVFERLWDAIKFYLK